VTEFLISTAGDQIPLLAIGNASTGRPAGARCGPAPISTGLDPNYLALVFSS